MTRLTTHRPFLALGAAALMLGAVCANAATPAAAQLTAMTDRAAIENMYVDYYAGLGVPSYDFSQHFTEDGTLDVNGIHAKGRDEIKALYVRISGGSGEKPKPPQPSGPPRGKFQMQLTNLKVEVNGNTARVEAFWSSLLSATVIAPPKVTEYGREQADLVKRDGHWLITNRVVTSYGGMPEGELTTYTPR